MMILRDFINKGVIAYICELAEILKDRTKYDLQNLRTRRRNFT
jgi:hypothetical protein